MTSTTTSARTIATAKRLRNSINGNPRYRFTFTNHTSANTATDHGFVYGGLPLDGDVLVTIGGRGTIVDMVRAEQCNACDACNAVPGEPCRDSCTARPDGAATS